MRSLLLWAAREPRLRDYIPRTRFAQRAVRRFIPGESMDDAFAAAGRLQGERIGVLLTQLGENITTISEADTVVDHYMRVLDADVERQHTQGRVEISIKPTQLGLALDTEACYAHCHRLATRCAETGTTLWLDMEGSDYVEATVALAVRLLHDHDNVGLALQAYLKRTAADIERLLPVRPAIRLVKGAYDESEDIAYRDSGAVDANYQSLAVVIAEAAGRGEARLALGTHDVELIERISTIAEARGVDRKVLEVHMLYGIREDELRRLRDEGYPTSSLVVYGPAWYAWYMRRLAERPANIIFALRQLLP